MSDREKVVEKLGRVSYYFKSLLAVGWQGDADIYREHMESVNMALALLKEQDHVLQKMWNALYAEEDKLEKKLVGTDEHDNWFTVYRPWLQRGFEIGIEVIAKQEGGEAVET